MSYQHQHEQSHSDHASNSNATSQQNSSANGFIAVNALNGNNVSILPIGSDVEQGTNHTNQFAFA
jgi:hypothetical protein